MIKIVALTTSLLSSVVFAQSDMYFGVGVGKTSTDTTNVVIEATSYAFKYEEVSYRALIGKRLNDNMSVELQYTDFTKDNTIEKNSTWTAYMSVSSIGVSGVYHFNPQADFSPFVKLGVSAWDVDLTIKNMTTGVSANGDEDGTDVLYGVGVDGKITDTMKYRVEFERLDEDIDSVSAGVLFDF